MAKAVPIIALLALTAQVVSADNVGGKMSVEIDANSGVLVSMTYVRDANATLTVNTVVSGSGVTVKETLASDVYDSGKFYVRFADGNAEGLWTTITSNTTTALTFEDTSFLEDANFGVAPNDTMVVYPHHTLKTVFRAELEHHTWVASPNSLLSARKTRILVPDDARTGINKGSAITYYYIRWNSPGGLIEGWRDADKSLFYDAGDDIIKPDSYVAIINPTSAKRVWIARGNVATGKIGTNIPTEAVQYDFNFTTGRAAPMTLADLMLEPVFAFSPDATLGSRRDRLLVYENNPFTGGSFIPSSSKTYYYIEWNSPGGLIKGWRDADKSVVYDASADVIPAGSALIIRKDAGDASEQGNNFWTQSSPINPQ
jgi:uncharacterized protein (TIGR02597 family)